MNRRRFARQPVSVSALVHPAKGRSWLCGIRDFCQQGMMLTGSGTTRSLAAVGADPRPGDQLAVHFSVPSPTGTRHFRVQAKIARMLEDGKGVGVMFDPALPAPAFEALLDYARATGLAAPPAPRQSTEAPPAPRQPTEAPPAPQQPREAPPAPEPAKEVRETPAIAPGGASVERLATPPKSAAAPQTVASPAAPQGSAVPQPAEVQEMPAAAAAASAAAAPAAAEAAEPALGDDLGIPLEFLRDGRLPEAQAGQARALIRSILEPGLRTIAIQFVEIATREFLASARDAASNALHLLYLGALDQLEKRGDLVADTFLNRVIEEIERPTALEEVLEKRRRRQTGGGRELRIVDEAQFEDWLAVVDIITKAEERHGPALLELRARLGLVARSWAHKEAIPVGPAIIAWAFADTLKDENLRRNVVPEAYRYFEQAFTRNLGALYERLSEALETSGLFPTTSSLREALRRAQTPRPAPPRPSPGPGVTPGMGPGAGPASGPEAYQAMENWVREAVMAADGIRSVGGATFDPYAAAVPRNAQAYRAVRNLLGATRRREATGSPPPPPEQVYTRDEILEALAAVEQEVGDAPPSPGFLKSRLADVLRSRHGGAKQFDPEDLENLSVMETLVDSLEADRYITEGARGWIRRLELTLNKLAARDRAFLDADGSQAAHGAVTLLNHLARLGSGSDTREGIERDIGRQVDELLQRLVREYDRNPEVLGDVVDELDPLVDKQARSFRGNLERTVRASEGKQKLDRARRAVLKELARRLAGQDVPELLLQLVNPGWRNLLVHTHLRRGVESTEWTDQLAILDQLQGQLQGTIGRETPGYVEPETLLKRVVQGLNSISFDPARRTPLVMALSAALVGDAAGVRAPIRRAPVEASDIAKAVGLEGLERAREPEPDIDDERERVAWSRALARARRIEVGEWIATTDADGRPLILSVAFLGDDFDSFVLVNRKGVRVRELTLKEMADGIHAGQITLLDDFDLPLMERASQRMLESMHSRLAFQASHDELTTLINRREFERRVENSVQAARTRGEQHALLYVDLDQFKIINNTSGHTAGDELLKRLATMLSTRLAADNVQIARLGGDEFGVLAESTPPAEARVLARRLLDDVREFAFEWEGRSYNLSASIGLVLIDQATESVDLAMQHADEACYAAKDAGRNRVQEYAVADAAIQSRHGIMEWVTQLDRAIAEDRLILNCQRIMPLDPARGHEAHYEILLTMANEQGQIMPPAEFILAAETYQRMGTVDRWVIQRVLEWMADHRDALEDFGGFSINVSGHSINEETFPDFVLEQFVRTQAPTGKVCFEITETAAITNLENAREFMNRMKIIGCRFSLDDFGTGVSSYSYLRNLPVDFVKIDGVFVRDVASDDDDYAVVRSINEIGHYLGKQTIAECVESAEVLARLEDIGVDFAQGFHLGKPGRLEDLVI
ncbi:MAG: DUF1631 family protein [Pseudomonadales bacterium]|nr:DUF1631 family protein [Pseudomonadales bacterium]